MMLRAGSLCSGIGGLELGLENLGIDTVWQSEIDPDANRVLDRWWPDTPNLGDLRAVDWATVEQVDLMTFGFPCQDISAAGGKAGINGDRSAIWFDCADAVRVVRPRLLFVENVAALVHRGLDVVLADLHQMGYMGSWGCVRSSDVGAPHRRERVFIAAVAADDPHDRRAGAGTPRRRRTRPADNSRATVADPDPDGRGDGPQRHRQADRSDDGPRRDNPERRAAPDPGGAGLQGRRHLAGRGTVTTPDDDQPRVEWGPYAAAIERWEHTLGRTAPPPVDGRGRLAPRFVEWMMGYPPGWVTGLSKTAALRCLGNSAQPQTATLAAELLLVPLTGGDPWS